MSDDTTIPKVNVYTETEYVDNVPALARYMNKHLGEYLYDDGSFSVLGDKAVEMIKECGFEIKYTGPLL